VDLDVEGKAVWVVLVVGALFAAALLWGPGPGPKT
jgi:hypothetical protein